MDEVEEYGEEVQIVKGKEVLEFLAVPKNLEISPHALLGFSSPKTMKVKGKVIRQWATILIDYGNTHNFVDAVVAWKSQFPIYDVVLWVQWLQTLGTIAWNFE